MRGSGREMRLCPGHNANEKTQSNPQEADQRSRQEIRSPVRHWKRRLFSPRFLVLFYKNAFPGHNARPGPGSRCCAIKRVSREPTQNAGVESGFNGKIEMFGLQGSSSSPTDPLFTRLSLRLPNQGPRHANTTPFVSMQPLSLKKENVVDGRMRGQRYGAGARAEYRQLGTRPRK